MEIKKNIPNNTRISPSALAAALLPLTIRESKELTPA